MQKSENFNQYKLDQLDRNLNKSSEKISDKRLQFNFDN